VLILTRRLGESVVIGDAIRIHILGVEGERVKLGIEAPREVTIVRSELLERVREANLEAAQTGPAKRRTLPPVLQRTLGAKEQVGK
jgi:carbon storage regulator